MHRPPRAVGPAVVPRLPAAGLLALLAAGCAASGLPGSEAAATISANRMLERIRTLASDAFQGRGTGTPGGARTEAYLVEALRALGLAPAPGTDGYLQPVPLVGATLEAEALELTACGARRSLPVPAEGFALARSPEEVALELPEAPLVFVGHGASAPEEGWDDFAGADLTGKVALELPGEPEPPGPGAFAGPALTRHAFAPAKDAAAARAGALGRLTLFVPGAAGMRSWAERQALAARERLELAGPPDQPSLRFVGELGPAAAEALLGACHLELAELRAAAARPGFRPRPLEATVRVTLRQRRRPVLGHNVAAVLPGRDPALASEVVLYTAHWDHLGQVGGRVFHGARDNASGVAALLEVAAAYAALPTPPRRTVVFLFTTAEEHGLLGARQALRAPLVPAERLRAELNLDMMNVAGPTRDLGVAAPGPSPLSERLARLAARQGRQVVVGAGGAEGLFFRSDQLPFAEAGVPVLFITPGRRRLDTGAPLLDETPRHYHQPSDMVDPGFDLTGAALDARLLFALGYELAEERLEAAAAEASGGHR